jgi:hypothetical protein
MRTTLFITLLAFLTACLSKTPPQAGIVVPSDLSADEARIIATARQFLSTNQSWPDAKFERPRRSAEGGWTVLVWKLPATPELDMMITIDDAGHVTHSHIGL